MKLQDFGLLKDEHLDPAVVAFLRQRGFDVWDVCENKAQGSTDVAFLRRAFADQRVIVTHDQAFGTLAILRKEPLAGILFLRPGSIDARFTIETLEQVLAVDRELNPPFVLVAKRTGSRVAIRVRSLVR